MLKHQGYALSVLVLLLVACGPESWQRAPQVQTAKKACKGLDQGERYACIERHAVETLNPDVCRLAGIWIDDMCLQAVYEVAGDPTICERLYLEGVRPACRAYYAPWPVLPQPPAGEPGSTSQPVPAPHWRQILFSYNHDGVTELWTIDSTSGEAQRQTRPEQTVQDPALSPSGEAVAYVRVTGDYDGIVSELWLMDRDGANPRSLYAPSADQSVLSRPAWSPDGQEVYFLQHGSGASSGLLRMPVTPLRLHGEATTVLSDSIDFALSPNGEWLASVSLARRLSVSRRDGTWVRDLEPRGSRFTDYDLLAVSPDGELLAFRATEEGREDTWNLYVMGCRGHDVRRLTSLSGFHPFSRTSGQVNGLAWTADGAHLVYSVDGHPEQSGLWLISLDGGRSRHLFAWAEGEWASVQGPWFELGDLPR